MTPSQSKSVAEDMLHIGHFLFKNASWELYEHLLALREKYDAFARITYDEGLMEIFTGGDVYREMGDLLPEWIERFSFSADTKPTTLIKDLHASRDASSDLIWVISPTRLDENAIKLTLQRTLVPTKESPVQFELSGMISPRIEASERAVFPGISMKMHLQFFKDKSNQ